MIKIKPYKQSPGWCGAACFKMVMDYYGIKKSEKGWAELTPYSKDKKGKILATDDEKFVEQAKKLGFKGFCKDGSSIAEIRSYVKKGIPVIVNWFSPEECGHFSVVVGFEKDKIVLADPHFGKIKKWKIDTFEERWFDHVPWPIKSVKDVKWVRRICVVYPT